MGLGDRLCTGETGGWETRLLLIRLPPLRRLHEIGDVLLQPEVVVHEPLWTVIPSNKAILPVMWTLFPEHPYLLNSQFEMTEALRQSGYVEKPIVGRSGENIAILLLLTSLFFAKPMAVLGSHKKDLPTPLPPCPSRTI